eukprot:CAMPEP_0182522424 /NCGR_PEP_ID=MMETSP1323-20130603/287_1 /TAXON_ID=236787 /ORGANISM="Florenciella parvula, Strain RCC1693" /LENGTH=150 /DNA_ID=CAMNT_0024730545 /DNA_START=62 /DNA_END=512 /DNA_ORIENTATION=+
MGEAPAAPRAYQAPCVSVAARRSALHSALPPRRPDAAPLPKLRHRGAMIHLLASRVAHHRAAASSREAGTEPADRVVLGDGEVREHIVVPDVRRGRVAVLVRGPLELGHIRVARAHILVLDVVPRLVDVLPIGRHLPLPHEPALRLPCSM